jgi:hypothetical protein
MTTAASRPGQLICRTARNLQADAEHGIVKARTAVDTLTDGRSPLDSFVRTSAHAVLGFTHGVVGMETGVLNAVGGLEQAVTDPAFDAKAGKKALEVLAHPVRAAQKTADAVGKMIQKDAAYTAGDFASLAVPMALGAAIGGVPGSAIGLVAGSVAAAVSPQPRPAIYTPNE